MCEFRPSLCTLIIVSLININYILLVYILVFLYAYQNVWSCLSLLNVVPEPIQSCRKCMLKFASLKYVVISGRNCSAVNCDKLVKTTHSSIVSLLSHCHLIVISLLSHCYLIVLSLLPHCYIIVTSVIVISLLSHCYLSHCYLIVTSVIVISLLSHCYRTSW